MILIHNELDVPGQFVRIQKPDNDNKKRKAETETPPETSENSKRSKYITGIELFSFSLSATFTEPFV